MRRSTFSVIYLLLSTVACGLPVANWGYAQTQEPNRYEPPRYVEPKPEPNSKSTVGLDGGEPIDLDNLLRAEQVNPADSRVRRNDDHSGDWGSRTKVSIKDGVKTTWAVDNGRKIKIIEDPNRGIVVEVTREYSPAEMSLLKRKMPALSDYIDSFPIQVDQSRIELTIGVTTRHEAIDEQHLKSVHAAAYNIFKRFTREALNATDAGIGNRRPVERNLPSATTSGGSGKKR